MCPTTKTRFTFLTQRQWRTIGMISLATCAFMAWYGSGTGFSEYGLRAAAIYWGFFCLSFLVTFYMVLLDFRYIRMEYKMEERALFEDTLGNPELRDEIRRAREKMEKANNINNES